MIEHIRTIDRTRGTAPTEMTTQQVLARLNTFYQIATRTGQASTDYLYIELADDIHRTIKAVMCGADAAESLQDLANEWLATSRLTPDGPTARKIAAWSGMIGQG